MNFNKKNIIEVIAIILVVLFFIFVFKIKKPVLTNQNIPIFDKETNQVSKTWQNISDIENIQAPNENSENLPSNIAKPKSVSSASEISEANIRIFSDLIIENDNFKPDTFILKKGDIFDVFVKATDKDYDWTQPDYGYVIKISKGETKRIQFQVSAEGKFTFYCSICGGPDSGPKGYLIVVSR